VGVACSGVCPPKNPLAGGIPIPYGDFFEGQTPLDTPFIGVFILLLAALAFTGCPTDSGGGSSPSPGGDQITIHTIPLEYPVAGESPTAAKYATIETDQFTGEVTWKDNPTVFAPNTSYTAYIKLTPKGKYNLSSITSADWFSKDYAKVTWNSGTSTVTVEFPATGGGSGSEILITRKEILLPGPKVGVEPTKSLGTNEISGTVTWYPDDSVFKGNTPYTATIILKPVNGWRTDVGENFFEVSGAKSVTNEPGTAGEVTVTVEFEGVRVQPINNLNIYIEPPITGNLPKFDILDHDQCTGTITWTRAGSGDLWSDDPNILGAFASGVVYTASIAIEPKTGYTLVGVAQDSFIVNDNIGPRENETLKPVNAEDKGAVVVTFKATNVSINRIDATLSGLAGPKLWEYSTPPPTGRQLITSVELRGIRVPNYVASPTIDQIAVTQIEESPYYKGSVSWDPPIAEGTIYFDKGTQYTATVTLTAKDGFTLAGVPEGFFTVPGSNGKAVYNANSNTVVAKFFRTSGTNLDGGSNAPKFADVDQFEIFNIRVPTAGAYPTPHTAITGGIGESATEAAVTAAVFDPPIKVKTDSVIPYHVALIDIADPAAQYSIDVKWTGKDNTVLATNGSAVFATSTVYTATVTLTENQTSPAFYTLANVDPNLFKLHDHPAPTSAVRGKDASGKNTITLTIVYPQTKAQNEYGFTQITDRVIYGIPSPVNGRAITAIATGATSVGSQMNAAGTAYVNNNTIGTYDPLNQFYLDPDSTAVPNPVVWYDTAAPTTAITANIAAGSVTAGKKYIAIVYLTGDTSHATDKAKKFTFNGVPGGMNYFTIANMIPGTLVESSASSGTITITFPTVQGTPIGGSARIASDTPIAITLPRPRVGEIAPNNLTIDASTNTALTAAGVASASVSWNPAPVNGKFVKGVPYTATIILTPATGYSVVGIYKNMFSVVGSVPNNGVTNDAHSGVVTVQFPESSPGVIAMDPTGLGANSSGSPTDPQQWVIQGLKLPVTGQAAYFKIDDDVSFTTSVSWEPTIAVGGTFQSNEVYTATINFAAKEDDGYTLTNLAANHFKIPQSADKGYDPDIIGTGNRPTKIVGNNIANNGIVVITFPITDTTVPADFLERILTRHIATVGTGTKFHVPVTGVSAFGGTLAGAAGDLATITAASRVTGTKNVSVPVPSLPESDSATAAVTRGWSPRLVNVQSSTEFFWRKFQGGQTYTLMIDVEADRSGTGNGTAAQTIFTMNGVGDDYFQAPSKDWLKTAGNANFLGIDVDDPDMLAWEVHNTKYSGSGEKVSITIKFSKTDTVIGPINEAKQSNITTNEETSGREGGDSTIKGITVPVAGAAPKPDRPATTTSAKIDQPSSNEYYEVYVVGNTTSVADEKWWKEDGTGGAGTVAGAAFVAAKEPFIQLEIRAKKGYSLYAIDPNWFMASGVANVDEGAAGWTTGTDSGVFHDRSVGSEANLTNNRGFKTGVVKIYYRTETLPAATSVLSVTTTGLKPVKDAEIKYEFSPVGDDYTVSEVIWEYKDATNNWKELMAEKFAATTAYRSTITLKAKKTTSEELGTTFFGMTKTAFEALFTNMTATTDKIFQKDGSTAIGATLTETDSIQFVIEWTPTGS